ncbi:desulfoferrodoxin [Halonatronum saccharophilum]|uniref:desulfoferrodoxin n=1 Tax=Halonatronum saccharophilum TaxID=150060 RepID=UPI000489F006|nr:desulfoferrodoxin [Halonatronum saccharophilum]
MTNLRDLYKCQVCGHVVEIVHKGQPTLVCCDEKMNKLEEQTEDATIEKHVPVVEEIDGGIEVTVGSTEHPMTEKHYIQFIEVLTSDKVLRAELKPGDKPTASFNVNKNKVEKVREYCNLHNLWRV